MDLIPSTEIRADLFVAEESKTERQFTAARFFQQHPQEYREIVSLRAEGISIAACARLFSVSRHTVAAIDKRETSTESFIKQRDQAAYDYRRLARLGRERLEELLLDPENKPTAKDLAVMIGILEDKAQLLSGAPTQRVDLQAADAPSHAALVAHLKQLRDQYDRSMGLGSENRELKAVAGESRLVGLGDGTEAGALGTEQAAAAGDVEDQATEQKGGTLDV
jgi:DNA-binding transcriptional regulator YiaG